MKSTLNNSGQTELKAYPKLMIDEEYGMVVLFVDEDYGTCVFSGASGEPLGRSTAYTADDWNDYTGTITLEN